MYVPVEPLRLVAGEDMRAEVGTAATTNASFDKAFALADFLSTELQELVDQPWPMPNSSFERPRPYSYVRRAGTTNW